MPTFAAMNSESVPRSELPRKPAWLKIRLGGGQTYSGVSQTIQGYGLHTICSSGRCPNQGECWTSGTASFMILGNVCTRQCRFCATASGHPLPPDTNEPLRLATSIRLMGLRHAVITSVDRDDLPDGGAAIWVETIATVRELNPATTIEVLLPDFMGKPTALTCVLAAAPDVAAHNVETVERLTPTVRSRAKYRYSLGVLERISQSGYRTKSGLMLGLGEREAEVEQTLRDMLSAGVQYLTIGQYLQPRRENLPVLRYYTPEEFNALGQLARSLGFAYVESGPLVRSSFHAERALEACGVATKTEAE